MRPLIVLAALALLAQTGRLAGQTGADTGQDLTSLSLEELLEIRIEGAALHPQSQSEAPASVTVITASDIRTYGYRTLADALAATRGFYLSNNRTFHSVGVRGFNLPGDYASRFLVLVNGHQMADNMLGFQPWFGQDFPIDMSLVERIEVIRGPASSIYGSNGIFATINIITRSPAQAEGPALIVEAGNFGEKKMQALGAFPIGQAHLLLSGSLFNNTGESPLYLPEFDAPETNSGQALRMDNEKGYRFFSNLTFGQWSLLAAASEREKVQAVSWGPTVFNDRGTRVNDSRRFVEAAYLRELGRGTLRWRAYYDSFYERGRYQYALPADAGAGVEDNAQPYSGDWIGTQLSYRFGLSRKDTMTIGAEGRLDLRASMAAEVVSPVPAEYFSVDRRDKSFAVFVQNERRLNARWRLDLGARMDVYAYRQTLASPRAALIYQPSTDWTYKFLYGRGFRNPTAFELFFDDGFSAAGNPDARQESADTIEVDVERRIGKRVNLVGAVYAYRLRDLLVGIYTPNGVVQYQNVGKIHASGFEIEMDSRPRGNLQVTASYAFQKSRDAIADAPLSNSPDHVAKLRFAVPLGRRLEAASLMQYHSRRATLAGATLRPVYLADFVFTSRRLLPNLDIQFSLRNAFNRQYSDPVALNSRVDRMPQRGRAFVIQLISSAAR